MTEKPSQSQNFSNSPVYGQVAQGSNINQVQNASDIRLTQQPSTEEVNEALTQLTKFINELSLPHL